MKRNEVWKVSINEELINAATYKPGGLRKGASPYIPSTSTGSPITRVTRSGILVFPFHVENHGPPPTSAAAMLLVTSKITYVKSNFIDVCRSSIYV